MIRLYIKSILCFWGLASLIGCTLAFDEIETSGQFNPKIAIPLIETRYKLTDLTNGLGANNNLYVRPDGQFEIQFKGNFTDMRTFNVLATLPDIITIPAPFDPTITTPFPNPTGMKIDYIDFKKGKFKWTMTNNKTKAMTVTVSFYSLTKNNVFFEKTFPLQAGLTLSSDMDLVDWRLKSTELGKMVIGYKALMDGVEEKLSNVAYEISGMEAKQVVGYFGQLPISLSGENLNINLFENTDQNRDIRLTDPSLTITVENSLGFPCNIKSKLAEMTLKDGTKSTITSSLTSGIDLKFPFLNEIGTTKQTAITINKQNSNIESIMNANPNSIALALNVLGNPDLSNKQMGFITENSGVRFKMDFTLPLIPMVKNFVYYDTLDVNFSDFKQLSDVEFKILTENTIPLDLGIQAYFISANTIIDSLVDKQTLIIKSAETFKGQVVSTTTTTTYIDIDAAKFNIIRNAPKMIIKYTVSTAINGSVPVYLKADQSIFMRIGVRAKV